MTPEDWPCRLALHAIGFEHARDWHHNREFCGRDSGAETGGAHPSTQELSRFIRSEGALFGASDDAARSQALRGWFINTF